MNKKIILATLSILAIFFLTAQTCSFGGVSTGLAADCVGEGDIVCDETKAYQCQLATYGVGYYVTRASAYDVSDCGAEEAVDTTTDTDGDGLTDYEEENTYLTDPNDKDSDNDFLPDGQEVDIGTDPLDSDSDGDTLIDGAEVKGDQTTGYTSDPLLQDTDGDTYLDADEVAAGTDPDDSSAYPTTTTADDTDGDGVSNADDLCEGYNDADDANNDGIPDGCDSTDTDGDGLTDAEEADLGTDPSLTDTDSDGLSDADEVNTYGTDPTNSQSDEDGLADGYEVLTSLTDPLDADMDDDGLDDNDELSVYGTDPAVADTDGDGDSDSAEVTAGTDPLDATSYSGLQCTDTDGGSDEFTVGTASTAYADGTSTFSQTDTCSSTSSTTLTEYSCSGDTIASTAVTCEVQCYEGACLAADEDTDGDGLSNGVEAQIALDPTTDEISASNIFSSDGDWLISGTTVKEDGYEGTLAGTIVSTYKDGNWYLDMTSATTTDLIFFPGTTYDWDFTDGFIIKVKVMPGSDTSGTQPIVLHATSTCGKPQYMLSVYGGQYRLGANIGGVQESAEGGRATSDTWQEVVGVYKDNKLYLFVDGELVDTEDTIGALETSTKRLYFGHSDVTLSSCALYDYEGSLGIVEIWGE